MDPNCVSSDDFNPEDDFVCPYFPEHNKVQGKQLPYHLMKCRKVGLTGCCENISCFFYQIMYMSNISWFGNLGSNQGNLKGEFVVAAILPSRMEVIFSTSGFFCRVARQIILLSVTCLSPVDSNHACI